MDNTPQILDDLTPSSTAGLLLADYYRRPTPGESPRFSGSQFEQLPPTWRAEEDRFSITPTDIIATQFLGVSFKRESVLQLLYVDNEKITELLRNEALRPDARLWDSDQAGIEADDSPANELWHAIRGIGDIGPVKTSKLMARKRPQLFPVYDKWVRKALGMPDSAGFYTRVRDLMLSEKDGLPLHRRLQSLIGALKLPSTVTALRACDVILWYSHNPNKRKLKNEALAARANQATAK